VSLMSRAAQSALEDSGLHRRDIDGILCGYSTVIDPHRSNMLASVFSEHFGLAPSYCHGVTVAGATGAAMAMLASTLVSSGQCHNVLVVAAENRRTGVSSDSTLHTLAGVGHPDFEAPFGTTIPAYYALVASTYLAEFGLTEEDLAEFAVLMRSWAVDNQNAHMRVPITVEDVMDSREIARPLKLLDCCPNSDGGCAIVISDRRPEGRGVRIAGAAQTHPYQHVIAAPSLTDFGAGRALSAALSEADVDRASIDIAGIYDSFTITLLAFIEDLGLAPRGGAAEACRQGEFGPTGRIPVNSHGGLLSFGHSGVAGGLAHIIEIYQQMAGKAGSRQLGERNVGILHGEGGILSSQVSLVAVVE
jgi:acetyl-CoA acetyltransferase